MTGLPRPICGPCWSRLHPLGYGCPLSVHVIASEGQNCECNTHIFTDLQLANQAYFPELTKSAESEY